MSSTKGRVSGAMRAALAAAIAALAAGCAAGGNPGADAHVIRVTDKGFEPKVTVLERGKPATLLVTRRSDHTCATQMVFAALDTSYDLPLDRTVQIALPASRPDTLRYACGMDMFTGMVVTK